MVPVPKQIRVLAADDHPVYLDGLRTAIEAAEDLDLVASCADGRTALRTIRAEVPDVAVLDLRLPELTAPQVLQALASTGDVCPVLVVSAHVATQAMLECLSLGAAGFLGKEATRTDICDAVRVIAHGDAVLSTAAQNGVVDELRRRGAPCSDVLTSREQEILTLLAAGSSAPDIARRLFLSTATVKTHLHHLYRKLGVSDRAAAVAVGIRAGLIE